VIEVLRQSGNGLVRPEVPLSPIEKIVYLDLLMFGSRKIFLTYLTMVELTAPQRPLSEVIGTRTTFGSELSFGIFFCIN